MANKMNIITIHNTVDDEIVEYPYESLIFPGGEPHIKLDPKWFSGKVIWINARIGDCNGFMTLMCLIDAIKACKPKKLGLFIPYLPGARQDRREFGTAHTLRVYAEMIKAANLDLVVVVDPHSNVLEGILDPRIVGQEEIVPKVHYGGYDAIICPDAGAEKRVSKVANELKVTSIIHASKKRDVVTGKLSGFSIQNPLIFPDNNKVYKYLIVDDICDGGGTFIGLAKEINRTFLQKYQLDLFISHAIFSKGIDDLLQCFNRIITTDSFPFENFELANDWIKYGQSKVLVSRLIFLAQDIMKKELI